MPFGLLEALAGLSWTLWVIVPVLLLAFGLVYVQERDARTSSKRVAGGVGALVVGVVAVGAGLAEGLAGAAGGVSAVLAPHAGFLTHLGLTGLGYVGLSSDWIGSARTFLVFAALLIALSVVWGE